jgi:hypothetical protein
MRMDKEKVGMHRTEYNFGMTYWVYNRNTDLKNSVE